jgi:hypothetical protein
MGIFINGSIKAGATWLFRAENAGDETLMDEFCEDMVHLEFLLMVNGFMKVTGHADLAST